MTSIYDPCHPITLQMEAVDLLLGGVLLSNVWPCHDPLSASRTRQTSSARASASTPPAVSRVVLKAHSPRYGLLPPPLLASPYWRNSFAHISTVLSIITYITVSFTVQRNTLLFVDG